jgi:hypothetical protein
MFMNQGTGYELWMQVIAPPPRGRSMSISVVVGFPYGTWSIVFLAGRSAGADLRG